MDMTTALKCGQYQAEHADLSGSVFRDVNLGNAKFDDVNLRGAQFHNVALTNATIRDACLGNVTIEGASYEGMRIEGILVADGYNGRTSVDWKFAAHGEGSTFVGITESG
jgi:uncharacterized protein YjbI with pentapeptide repeats